MHERDKVQGPVVQFLEIDRWRMFRTQLVVQKAGQKIVGKVGELGQPDYLAIRYKWTSNDAEWWSVQAEVMWLEFKRGKSGRISKAQELWHAAERKRGALVLVVSNFDEFRRWYIQESGLNRSVKG